MTGLFSIEEIIAATGGQAQNIKAQYISSVSIDTRSLEKDALYVAIVGERFDGHDFVADAIKNGAAAALISSKHAKRFGRFPTIIVPDALAGMVDIAKAARNRSKAKIVAITGSAGKTTTKIMVEKILSGVGKTHASIKSFNNHWGVPLMLANMPDTAKFGVFEIGMNHGGEITPLAKLVSPDIVLITSIGSAHLGNFLNMDGIANAKAEIFSGLKSGGVAIVNSDHTYVEILAKAAQQARFITYGFGENADVKIENYHREAEGSSAEISMDYRKFKLELKTQGEHMIANGVGALCAAEVLAVDLDAALKSLADFTASSGRGQVMIFGDKTRHIELSDESYNANPSSMALALRVFSKRPKAKGNRVLILGEMLELGEKSLSMHAGLEGVIREVGPDRVFLIGEHMRALAQLLSQNKKHTDKEEFAQNLEVLWAVKIKDICGQIVNGLDWGDQIMVKGSNGVGLSQVVEAIRDRFAGHKN